MQELELKISQKDWIIIFAIGVIFSIIVTSLLYFLLELDFISGIIFGGLLGFTIVLFSMLFITFLNSFILPKVDSKYWVLLAASFSFLSGFLATLITYVVSLSINIQILEKFNDNLIGFATILGLLTYIIGSLLYQFVKMSNQKKHNEKMLVQSRLKSLETQLNPHFLFNALNSLAELIHTDQKKADTALTQLSKFLRSSMQESALWSIEKELEALYGYINLENIRFEETIKLHLECDERFKKRAIPKFSIQLLVENAIKHSFVSNYEQFSIQIKIKQEQKNILITIENSGKTVESEAFGIGLSNLNERLKLLCNGAVALIDPKCSKYKILLGECNELATS